MTKISYEKKRSETNAIIVIMCKFVGKQLTAYSDKAIIMTDIKDKKIAIFGISRLRMGTDGKGITTLVAMMGCPLKCRYCLNDRCHYDVGGNGDGSDGHTLTPGIHWITPLELYEMVKMDNIYFQTTGGGICFGGGEPTTQHAFITAFIPLCPSHWRFTIESSLCCTTDAIEALAPHIDEWIVDVKDMNSYIYREYTSAEPVVKERLAELMKLVPEEKIRVKVPLIPDFNTDTDVERSVDELRAMGLTHIERTEYIVKPSK